MAVPGDLVFTALRRSTRAAIEWRSRLPEQGRFFGFRAAWNTRFGFWALSMETSEGVTLLSGMALRTGTNILAPFAGRVAWPAGQVFVEDTTGEMADPGRDSFLRSHRLIYRPASVAAAVAGTSDEVL